MPTRLDLEAFDAAAIDFDASVEAETGIDRFCSGSAWIVPFHRAFVPARELHLYRSGDSFVALAERSAPRVGVYLEPLETMWQFPCPIVGPRGPELLAIVERQVAARVGTRALPMVLSGIPLSGELTRRIASTLEERHEVRVADVTTRFVASLEGGLEGWLERRSASLRRNLRSAVRLGEAAALEFEHVSVGDAEEAGKLYSRILAVERKSWKSLSGEGADRGPMRAFYRDMLPRLAERGRLRVLFARQLGRDVGYLHGGTLERHFRGLQMSFDAALANLSVGNLLQREMIARLCDEGFSTYDLGSKPGYKERWSEPGLKTATLVCLPRR